MDFSKKIDKILMLETKCPYCGTEGAYVGATSVECTNPKCRFFAGDKTAGIKTIEFIFGRMIGGPYINGKEPDGEYSLGDNGKVDGLFVGGAPITSMEFDKDYRVDIPTKVIINYGGIEVTGHMIKNIVGDPDKDIVVKLANGEERELDETQAYVMFQV